MKNQRRNAALTVCLCAAAMMLASGCGSADGTEAAQKNVEKLMSAAQEADFDEMEKYIADESWDTNVLETLSIDAWNNFVVEQASKITYEITNVTEDGDTVVVTVDITYIDGEEAYSAAFNACFADLAALLEDEEASEELTEDDIYESLDEHLQEEAASLNDEDYLTDVTIMFACTKDDDWKIETVNDDFLSVVTANLTGYASDSVGSTDTDTDTETE